QAPGSAPWAIALPAGRRPPASTDVRPLIEEAATREALCALHGTLPGHALRVHATRADLRALLAHLAAIVRHALGTESLPRALVATQSGQMLLHWAAPEDATANHGAACLASRFMRMASAAVPPASADRALHGSVHAALAIVHAGGGRLAAAPSTLSPTGLTVRLPLE
ncbi:MAG: hypothetical protein QM586_12545, partial [Xenophilus sp.]